MKKIWVNFKKLMRSTILKNYWIKNLEWHQTCFACPEQYDIYYKGEKFAYFRFRFGYLTVSLYKNGELTLDNIYSHLPDPDNDWRGKLSENEFSYYKKKINKLLIEYLP